MEVGLFWKHDSRADGPGAAAMMRIKQAALAANEVSGELLRQVDVAIVDDPTIHALNLKHLGHDYPTDVLSFDLGKVGQVVVSYDTALANAAEYGVDTEQELLLYVIHGVLHLAGFRDKTEAEAADMRRAEAEALQRCFPSAPGNEPQPERDPDE
ncbi:Endoribonuclease YbeY [Pirellulimonas nuda]|uniref:Endoribonuclease YbeY n=1 Tax=Pirellulimonas nuda TaxID=2528009 RepID=A0A518D6C5_9BACT|nr:rRNA maturation RNase YbeY [Pirellulimonas nuda]QDU87024.1 Endoribonuclease YbeY [Pirellulimonas nuda]